MARVQEPFSQDLPGAELSERGGGGGGRSLSVLQQKHVGIRRHTFHPVFLNVREIPDRKPESSSLLPLVCGFHHLHLWFAEFCVDTTTPQPVTVLPGRTGPEAPSRSEEGV